MAKSLNNGIQVSALFNGNHHLLSRGFGPNTLRFFVLQAHYRSTLDFSEVALEGSEKGLKRLLESFKKLESIVPEKESNVDIEAVEKAIVSALSDDLNTPIAIAQFFELAKFINLAVDKKAALSAHDLQRISNLITVYFQGILGLQTEVEAHSDILDEVMDILITLRSEAKTDKNYALSDAIRNRLKEKGVELMDSKEGTTWKHN
jgi:cysteinyl-tRNA synthetase